MSTLRTVGRLSMLLARSSGLALLILSGCASFSGFRSGAKDSASNMKTTLAVGDKAMPVVSGEPGSSSASDEVQPASPSARRAANAENRISGRVYDEQGEPVDGATVRLAVGGSPGGKVNRVITDPSGGFTLRGLRPRSTYTLIAEWEGAEGRMTGRAEGQTADTGLKITLAPLDAGAGDETNPSRVSRVSGKTSVETDSGDGTASPAAGSTVVNEEDLPPALEAESVASPRAKRRAVAETEGPNRRQQGGMGAEPTSSQERSLPSAEDDGPNPLPPALEPAGGSASNGDDPLSSLASPPERSALSASRDPEDPLPGAAAPSGRSKRGARPSSEVAKSDADTIPGALVVVPETFAPVVIDDPESKERPDDPEVAPALAAARKVTRRLQSEVPQSVARRSTRSPSAGRPTWGDVASSGAEMPPLEGAPVEEEIAQSRSRTPDADALAPDWTKPSEGADAPAPDSINETSATASEPDPSLSQVAEQPPLPDDGSVLCDYDEKHRRILDFRLPDLQGKPVRFKDLDSDLILLDFWGTWCQPCLKSIPKLVELQAKNPGKKLTIVGIACEQGDFNEAANKVSATAEKFRINYPILMSRNDGSCPLQEAMHIQAFPTLILVDREGRVVWRDQGATPATIARLERLVLETPSPSAPRSKPNAL